VTKSDTEKFARLVQREASRFSLRIQNAADLSPMEKIKRLADVRRNAAFLMASYEQRSARFNTRCVRKIDREICRWWQVGCKVTNAHCARVANIGSCGIGETDIMSVCRSNAL
jgi:hypothetical protein